MQDPKDQYADGRAAKVWQLYIGSEGDRTKQYKKWLVDILRNNNCETVLDVACGTGVDSIMLLEEGFEVHSTDGSDQMLKYALRTRWQRRNEAAFDKWVIEEGNWLTLTEDIKNANHYESAYTQYDAVICLGNSFAHLPDADNSQKDHRTALANFCRLVKPGGILIIDHRNYDAILQTGSAPTRNVYYNSDHILGIDVHNEYVDGKPSKITLDYTMNISKTNGYSKKIADNLTRFSLSYYPHRLTAFSTLLRTVFGAGSYHAVYADFRPLSEVETPSYYIHVVSKAAKDNEDTESTCDDNKNYHRIM